MVTSLTVAYRALIRSVVRFYIESEYYIDASEMEKKISDFTGCLSSSLRSEVERYISQILKEEKEWVTIR